MVVTAGTRAYKPVARFANPALIVALLRPAGFNAFAFSAAFSVLWMAVVAASLSAGVDLRRHEELGGLDHREQEGRMTVFTIETLNALGGPARHRPPS